MLESHTTWKNNTIYKDPITHVPRTSFISNLSSNLGGPSCSFPSFLDFLVESFFPNSGIIKLTFQKFTTLFIVYFHPIGRMRGTRSFAQPMPFFLRQVSNFFLGDISWKMIFPSTITILPQSLYKRSENDSHYFILTDKCSSHFL